jgi:hypothetical protein
MLITNTHEQLDAWVQWLTLGTGLWAIFSGVRGYARRGWKKVADLERRNQQSEMTALKAADALHFSKITKLENESVSRTTHDQAQREISIRLDSMMAGLTRDIKEGFNQVNARIDKIVDTGRHI